tara:strand:+ start:264 stop:932 length:669 start_codon:yes stop_codon:yes gene_type:complete
MNSEDKILLMSYVDGELDAKQNLEAEKLIGENNLAMNFVNQLKIANNSIEASYQGENFNELNSRIDAFIEENFKEEKVSIVSLISSFFLSRQTLNYSLTALFFLSVGVFYDDYLDLQTDVEPQNSAFEEFTNNMIELQFLKTRSMSSEKSSEEMLIEAIKKIIDEKSKLASISYGNDIYRVELISKTVEHNGIECYEGTIFKDKKTEFIFCNNNNILSISYK